MNQIPNYQRPQAEIAQRLETTPNQTLDRIHAVVVGPALVHADAAAGNTNAVAYNSSSTLTYTRLVSGQVVVNPSTHEVLTDEVTLLASGLRAVLVEDSRSFEALAGNPTGSVLLYNETLPFLDTEDAAAAEAYDSGRPPTIGDIVRITDLSSDPLDTIERRIVGIQGREIDADHGLIDYYGASDFTPSSGDAEVELVFSSVTPSAESATIGNVTRLYAQRYGVVNDGDAGGLLLVVEAVKGSSGWTATVNGVAQGVVASGTTNTTLTLLTDLAITLTGAALADFEVGDRVSVEVAVDAITANEALLTTIDLTGYTYAAGRRRLPSALVVEVVAIADNGTDFTVRISDSSGLMTPVNQVVTDDPTTVNLSYDGVTIPITLDKGTGRCQHVGQRYVSQITPPSLSTTQFDKIVLNAPVGAIGNGAFSVSMYYPFSGTIQPTDSISGDTNFTAGPTEIAVSTIHIQVPGYTSEQDSVKPALDGRGTVAAQWRSVIPVSLSEGLIAIDTTDDIIAAYGSSALESELGGGLLWALSGSQGKRVYGLNTGGVDVDSFRAAIKKLEASRRAYAIAALTEDEDVMVLFSEHAAAMSGSTIKRFRRCYVGTDSPGEYDKIALQPGGAAYTGTIQAGEGGGYNLAVLDQEIDTSAVTVLPGDKFVVIGSGDEYVISLVQEVDLPGGGHTLAFTLASDAPAPVSPTAVKVVAADSPENVAAFVKARSSILGSNDEQDRRIANIWQHKGTRGSVEVPNRFGACEMAGLRSALQPQQGLTRTQIQFIDAAPAMYTQFSPTLLDDIASAGVWVIAQNSAEEGCYVRHQLTTSVNNGSLYYEDSAGTNVDAVCFAIDDIVEPKIGKRNATPRTVNEIKSEIIDMLNDLTQDDYDSEIGPQLVSFNNAAGDVGTLDVSINSTFKDRIDVYVELVIPLPLNNVKVVVLSRTIQTSGVTANELTTVIV